MVTTELSATRQHQPMSLLLLIVDFGGLPSALSFSRVLAPLCTIMGLFPFASFDVATVLFTLF